MYIYNRQIKTSISFNFCFQAPLGTQSYVLTPSSTTTTTTIDFPQGFASQVNNAGANDFLTQTNTLLPRFATQQYMNQRPRATAPNRELIFCFVHT